MKDDKINGGYTLKSPHKMALTRYRKEYNVSKMDILELSRKHAWFVQN